MFKTINIIFTKLLIIRNGTYKKKWLLVWNKLDATSVLKIENNKEKRIGNIYNDLIRKTKTKKKKNEAIDSHSIIR